METSCTSDCYESVQNETLEFEAVLPEIEAGYDGNITIPPRVVKLFKEGGHRRVVYSVNDVIEKFGAIMSDGKGGHYLYLNKTERRKLHQYSNGILRIRISPDHSRYGMPMPSELEEALYLYPESALLFEKTTPGKQRSIIYQVSKPKREETRIQRAIAIMEYLVESRGAVDLRDMMSFIRDFQND